jgi:hypothetical protein
MRGVPNGTDITMAGLHLYEVVLCFSINCKGHAAENWELDGGICDRTGQSQQFLSNQLKGPGNQDQSKLDWCHDRKIQVKSV